MKKNKCKRPPGTERALTQGLKWVPSSFGCCFCRKNDDCNYQSVSRYLYNLLSRCPETKEREGEGGCLCALPIQTGAPIACCRACCPRRQSAGRRRRGWSRTSRAQRRMFFGRKASLLAHYLYAPLGISNEFNQPLPLEQRRVRAMPRRCHVRRAVSWKCTECLCGCACVCRNERGKQRKEGRHYLLPMSRQIGQAPFYLHGNKTPCNAVRDS